MTAPIPMSDAELERRIRRAQHLMATTQDEGVRRAAAKDMADLIKSRSQGQVERMERARGLRS
jgi:hypothetical protein